MDNLEEKLNALLSDPETMQKIQAIAGSLGQPSPAPTAPAENQHAPEGSPLPNLSALQNLGNLSAGVGVDQNQKALLNALGPYLSRDRVAKLENAMRAAKMARMASSLLGNGGLQTLLGGNRHV